MAKIHEELEEIKCLSFEDLIDKRNLLAAERIKLESKLNQADIARKQGEIDEDWYSRCNFSYMKAGTLISAIESEIGIRKRKERFSFSEAFVKVAKETLPRDLYESLYEQSRQVYKDAKRLHQT